MKNVWWWIIGIGAIVLIGLAFLLGFGFLNLRGMPMDWTTGGWYGGPVEGWHHHGMRWGFPMMGFYGGFLMVLLIVGFLVLVVAAIVLLVRAAQNSNRDQKASRSQHCGHCGREVEPDWQVCPYCGETLKGQ
jgi:hypothetical protein